MFGTSEPALDPLDAKWSDFADRCGKVVEPDRILADVARLPTPRNRLHAPEAMCRADEILIESFTRSGWMSERQGFQLKRVRGYLDYARGSFSAGARPAVYQRLVRSEEHTSELQSQSNLVCRLLLEKKKHNSTQGM